MQVVIFAVVVVVLEVLVVVLVALRVVSLIIIRRHSRIQPASQPGGCRSCAHFSQTSQTLTFASERPDVEMNETRATIMIVGEICGARRRSVSATCFVCLQRRNSRKLDEPL